MVRSKEVPKKPKDPLLTPPFKPRGFRDDDGFGGSLPRNRGGAAMSPAPASVPNYMRATSSSGAKGGRRTGAGVPSSASPTRRGPVRVVTRGKVLFPTPEAPGTVRATCSSTMKEAKFPSALDLAPGATDAQGPAATRVCPYNYCSLNGHAHSPAVPLRSFLASRRRLIKTQQSMKHKGVSAFRKGSGHQRPTDRSGGPVVSAAKAAPLADEEAPGDFFVEVYGGPRVSSDMSCSSDMSLDEMDATVRRMEFVVFDRCGVGEDDEKGGGDPSARGDGDAEGTPGEERLDFCRDGSSECSDEGIPSGLISGNLVEELPWMRYECDSLDDDVSEEIQEAEVSERQDGKDEEARSRGSDGKHEEEAAAEENPEDEEEVISDLPRGTGIAAEEEGLDCDEGEGRDEGHNISDTVDQHEASTGEGTQHPEDDEGRVSDLAHRMEIVAEQACTVCAVEVCSEQEEEDEDNILGKVIQGGTSDGQGTSEEKLSNGVYEPEISENEVAERVENVLEEESSADQEAKDDQTNAESTGNLQVTEKQDMQDDESEMEISETVPSVACEGDLVEEEEVTSRAVSEGEISDCSAIASPDVEVSTIPTEGGFEQDVNTTEDASQQYGSAVNNSFETAEDTVDGTKDAQNELEITTCKLEDASEESGIAQESSQIVGSVCVVAAAQMEPEPVVTNCTEVSSEESGIAQESRLDAKPVSVFVDAAAQMEPEPEVANCKSEDSSEEFGITQESSQEVKPVCVDAAAQMEPETTKCNLEDASAEAGITGETVHDDSLAYVGEVAQVQSEVDTSQLVDTSEESGIAHEIGEDYNSAYVSHDAQSDSGIATCELGDSSEESATVQEADQDLNCTNVNGGSKNESGFTLCELAEASEAYDITQEASQDDNTPDVHDGAHKESEITMCNSEYSFEESGIAQESCQSVNSAYVKEDGAQIEPEFAACTSENASKEPATAHDDNSASLTEGPQKQLRIGTSELEGTSEESGIAHEIAEDDNSAYVGDDSQSNSGIATCGLIDTSEESVTVQEANQDYNCTDVSGGAKNELADASEANDITQEAIRVDGAQKETEIVACESDAREESDITQEGVEDDNTAGALKESVIITSKSSGGCEEVCFPEEANLFPVVVPAPEHVTEDAIQSHVVVPIPEHNHDFSTTDAYGMPQNVPTEDIVAKGFSIDDMCNVFSRMNLKGGVYVDPTESEISPRKRRIIAGRRRTAEEEEYMRGFNPKAPNFLPLESDPDSEKVDLKHQTAEDRKNAEEWMIDYALRRAVNNLGPARKKKVELLVQAFETVLPHDEDGKKNITPRPAQACN